MLDQIPHIAAQTIECSSKLGDLRNTVCDYLIPLVVRNLGCVDAAVDKAAHAALIQLIEQGFITKQQVEIQVCPSILALSKEDNTIDINASTGAITVSTHFLELIYKNAYINVRKNGNSWMLFTSYLFKT